MAIVKKAPSHGGVNALACLYLLRLIRAIPGVFEQLQEMSAQQLAEFALTKPDLASKATLAAVLKQRAAAAGTTRFANNCQLLDEQVGEGSELSLALLEFVTVYSLHIGLQRIIEEAEFVDPLRSRLPLLAALIRQPLEALSDYLRCSNWLCEMEILCRENSLVMGVLIRMDLSLAERLFNLELEDPVELLADELEVMSPSELTLEDYQHMSLGSLVEHARLLSEQPLLGWNALLWGLPGTGKTQLACLMAAEAGMRLYSLHSEENPSSRRHPDNQSRLRELMLAQRLLSRNGSCMLLVDEADDLLEFGTIAKSRRHQLLEQNRVPVIWTTNEIARIDLACMRRFNWVQKFENPNPDSRIRLFSQALRGRCIPKSQIATWAELTWLSPADIVRVAGLMKQLDLKRGEAVQAIEHWLEQRAEVMDADWDPLASLLGGGKGRRKGTSTTTYHMEGEFEPGLLNLKGRDGLLHQDIAIDELLRSLKHAKEGRVLLHGVPGTGKTALVHYLGQQIGCEVMQKMSSDLLGKHVGDSEKSIANAFAEASEKKAILFLDEVDSLLGDRRGHHQSWETSQVNELLQQIEHFDGILVVATNFLDKLDSAVARRFDYQIELCSLALPQLLSALEGCIDRAVLRELKPKLAGLGPVTLGDIAVIKRRQRLQQRKLDAAEVISLLAKLIAGRERGNSRPMGFVL